MSTESYQVFPINKDGFPWTPGSAADSIGNCICPPDLATLIDDWKEALLRDEDTAGVIADWIRDNWEGLVHLNRSNTVPLTMMARYFRYLFLNGGFDKADQHKDSAVLILAVTNTMLW